MTEAFDVMDAGRMAVFTDPEGTAFCVWQAKEHKGARLVNEHGTLNFNGLKTRDPEVAKKFYGSVFGWKTLDLGGGVEFWTLPGYGDYLEGITRASASRSRRSAAPRGSRTSSLRSIRSPTTSPTRPHTGASRSRSMTPTPRPRRRASSAGRCSRRHSTLRGSG